MECVKGLNVNPQRPATRSGRRSSSKIGEGESESRRKRCEALNADITLTAFNRADIVSSAPDCIGLTAKVAVSAFASAAALRCPCRAIPR